MKKLSLFSFVLIALHYSAVGQSVLIRPNSASPLSVKSSVTNYGNISTTSSNANLVFRINEPANGTGASGSITGAIESSGTEVSYNGYSGIVGLYGSTNLRLGTNGNRDRIIMLSNGNVGVNWLTPIAKFQVYKTGSAATGWGGYSRPLKAGVMVDGTHETLNDSYDAIGVAGHGNWANLGNWENATDRNNIGVLGTAGNTGSKNIGVYGYINQTDAQGATFYGLRGETQISSSNSAGSVGVSAYSTSNTNGGSFGLDAGAFNSGNGTVYGIYSQASGSGTGPKYGIYATASGSGTKYAGYFGGNVYVSGNVTANAGFINSDQRLKHKFTSLENSLTGLRQLNGYHYYWKDQERDQSLQTGLIAQEVEKLFPELIQKDEKGFLSVNYVGLIPHLIEAIKDLKTENESLQSDISEIKSLVAKLVKSESVSVPTEGKK